MSKFNKNFLSKIKTSNNPQSKNQLLNQIIPFKNQSINQSINQSLNPSINQSINQSLNPSIPQSINPSI